MTKLVQTSRCVRDLSKTFLVEFTGAGGSLDFGAGATVHSAGRWCILVLVAAGAGCGGGRGLAIDSHVWPTDGGVEVPPWSPDGSRGESMVASSCLVPAWAPVAESSDPARLSDVERLASFAAGTGSTVATADDGLVVYAVGRVLHAWNPTDPGSRQIAEWTRTGFQELTVTSDAVLWRMSEFAAGAMSHQIWRVSRSGGQPERLWTREGRGEVRIRARGGIAFFTYADDDGLSLFAAGRSDAMPREVLRLSGQRAGADFAIDDVAYYVIVPDASGASWRILAVDRQSNGRSLLPSMLTTVIQPQATSGFIYFMTSEPDGSRTIRRMSRDGACAGAIVTLPKDTPGSYRVDGDVLVWLSRLSSPNDQGLGKWETRFHGINLRTGAQAVLFASDSAYAAGFAIHGGVLYWIDGRGGSLHRTRVF